MNALITQKALAINSSLYIIIVIVIVSTWQCGRLDVTDLPKNRDIGFILDTGRGEAVWSTFFCHVCHPSLGHYFPDGGDLRPREEHSDLSLDESDHVTSTPSATDVQIDTFLETPVPAASNQ